jgi:pilus assembly protein CpaE
MATLRNTSRLIQLTERFGYPNDKVLLVVNRAKSFGSITLADVEQLLQRKPAVTIRSDWRLIQAANRGEPAVLVLPQTEFTSKMRELATIISGGMQAIQRVATAPTTMRAALPQVSTNGHNPAAGEGILDRGRAIINRSLSLGRRQG